MTKWHFVNLPVHILFVNFLKSTYVCVLGGGSVSIPKLLKNQNGKFEILPIKQKNYLDLDVIRKLLILKVLIISKYSYQNVFLASTISQIHFMSAIVHDTQLDSFSERFGFIFILYYFNFFSQWSFLLISSTYTLLFGNPEKWGTYYMF